MNTASELPTEWDEAAAQRATSLGIAGSRLFESRDLVRGAVGSEWLAEQQKKLDRQGTSISAIHPLFRQLTSPNDLALVEVCELAHYLRAFMSDPKIGDALKDLRGPKFYALLFELAMAYRWKHAGADVTLAPSSAKGLADFDASLGGTRFVVEVSRFEDDFVSAPHFTVPIGVIDTAEANVREGLRFVLKLRSAVRVSRQVEGELRHDVKSACRAFNAASERGENEITQASERWEITVEKLTPASEDSPFTLDEFGRQISTRDHDWNAFVRLPEVDGERGRVFMAFAADEGFGVDQIVAKAEKETRQLSGTPDPSIVMLDVTAFAGDIEDLDLTVAVDDFYRIMRSHQRLTALWFFTRQWTTAFRFKYRFTFLPSPYTAFKVPDVAVEKFIEREWKWDFLADREYEISSPDDAARSYASRMRRPTISRT